MMNVLNQSNKSDYYIGMSIPSKQSEYTPNCIVSSETILDYEDYDHPPPPQRYSSAKKQKRHKSNRHVFDIKEEDDADIDDLTDSDDDDAYLSEDDIEENERYYDDSDDFKQGHPAHNHRSNTISNQTGTITQHTHSNGTNGTHSNHNLTIEEDSEYTKIEALRKQLQQQQKQLELQSHQLKQLKHQIKDESNQSEELIPYHFDDDNSQRLMLHSSDSEDFPTLQFEQNSNYGQQQQKMTKQRLISPRTPNNPFSNNGSRKSAPSSPRNNSNTTFRANNNNKKEQQHRHQRANSGSSSSHKSKKQTKISRSSKRSDPKNSPYESASHHSSKRHLFQTSNSSHSANSLSLSPQPMQTKMTKKKRSKSRKSSIENDMKLHRNELNNTNYGNDTSTKNLNIAHISPPHSFINSPPLTPHSPHSKHQSVSSCSEHSHSNGTTGQQHKLNDIALPSTYYTSEYGDNHKIAPIADLFMDGIPEFEFTESNLEMHNKKLAKRQEQKKQKPKSSKYHYHQHQHQHLHHHHYVDPNNNNQISVPSLSHLSGVSTDTTMSKMFHPGNRLQFSKFQTPQAKQAKLNKGQNAPNLNPESHYSTAAALDPLDELDNMDVLNHYDKHKELGNGTDAFVYEVVDRRDNKHVAMKLTKRKSGRYKTEIHLLHQLRNCPYIVKLLNCLENDNVYVLILEHAPMSLENLLLQRCTKHPMQERVAKTIIWQILKGIQAIHRLGFVHKDIKPENILIFANRSERKLIAKVADFGFATRVGVGGNDISANINSLPKEKYLEFEKHVRDRCGTPGFWPPELVTQISALKHAFKMDVFSCGVTLYRMLCNEMPFGIFESWKYSVDHRDGQKKLCKVKPNWKVISWIQSDGKYTPVLSSRKLSDVVKDLLRSMLRIRPEQRSDVDSCLGHSFLGKSSSSSNGYGNKTHHNRHKSDSRNGHKSSSSSNSKSYSSNQQRTNRAASAYNRKYARSKAKG